MDKVLIVEDDPVSASILKDYLKDEPFDVACVETEADALDSLRQKDYSVVLLDLGLPDGGGVDCITKIKEISSAIEIIVITSSEEIDVALNCIRKGAKDFITKPVPRDRFFVSIYNALEYKRLKEKTEKLLSEDSLKEVFTGVFTAAPLMQDLCKKIEKVAYVSQPVLLIGEEGVGKGSCAFGIHSRSSFSDEDFVKIDLKNTPSKELEVKLSECKETTVYMKGIEKVTQEQQDVLLSVLGQGFSCRLICSSKKPLLNLVNEGVLEESLYHRLNVYSLSIPPLRDRGEDVKLLAMYFLRKYSAEMDEDFYDFDGDCMKAITDYHWPGNVRELENMMRSIVVLNSGNQETTVTVPMLPDTLKNVLRSKVDIAEKNIKEGNKLFQTDEIISLPDLEKSAVEHALRVCGGNVQEAAFHLKISPATLYRKRNNK